MGAKNKVISGDYMNKPIMATGGKILIVCGFTKRIEISKSTVRDYEIIDEEKRKSAASAVGRGLAGGLLLGPVGLLAGLSAKSKGIHTVAVQFMDGTKSLLEIDEKIYKELVKKMF